MMTTNSEKSTSDPPSTNRKASHHESDVYDRQIRLWGAEAQNKIRDTKVLYVHMSGVSSEALKNLVLAGVRAAICDGRPYPDAMSQTPSSFLPPSERIICDDKKEETSEEENAKKRVKKMTVAEAMQPHVLELNPLLETCDIENLPLSEIPDSYFQLYDIVIASPLASPNHNIMSKKDILRMADVTTQAGGKFFLVDTFGMYGCAIIDLGSQHQFRQEKGKDKLSDLLNLSTHVPLAQMMSAKLKEVKDRWHKEGPPKVLTMYLAILHYYEQTQQPSNVDKNIETFIKITQQYLKDSGLESTYLGDEQQLTHLFTTSDAQVSPVCAVLGGVLGNEVIKAISGKGQPANNVLLFDGTDGGCKTFLIPPPASQ
jgi:ubiquitin-like 1-activating enzyme E1 A